MSEKRNLSDLSKSFSDAVRTPKKQKDDYDRETTEMTTSTPVSQHDSSEFPPLPTVSNPQVGQQLFIGEEDIIRIATAVKLSIQNEICALVQTEVAKAVEPLKAKITKLETVNNDLHLQLDDLEQYGRRPLVRISGIPETPEENTTDLILDVTTKAGISLTHDDIIVSHRVGLPSNQRSRAPRQIIARLRSVDLKFRLVKSHKSLKRNPETKHVFINEDLTKRRNKLLFQCRELCRKRLILQAWSSNGKIRIRDLAQKTHIIRQECDLCAFGHTPATMDS
jgi:hypothetical protein